jgi:hypothetical protein
MAGGYGLHYPLGRYSFLLSRSASFRENLVKILSTQLFDISPNPAPVLSEVSDYLKVRGLDFVRALVSSVAQCCIPSNIISAETWQCY